MTVLTEFDTAVPATVDRVVASVLGLIIGGVLKICDSRKMCSFTCRGFPWRHASNPIQLMPSARCLYLILSVHFLPKPPEIL